MTVNGILTALEDFKKLLIEVELLKSENSTRVRSVENKKFSQEFLQIMYSNDYEKIYMTAMNNSDYDFLLEDDSFFQISAMKISSKKFDFKLRYAYYPNPFQYKSYKDFLEENGFSYEEHGDAFIYEYEQHISEAKLKNFFTPIRYDYDVSEYEPRTHAVSHLHIGLEQNMRIPISRVLTPQEFAILIIRNLYFEKWKLILDNENYLKILKKTKNTKNLICDELFGDLEKKYLYLN